MVENNLCAAGPSKPLGIPVQIYVSGPGADQSYRSKRVRNCPDANNSFYSVISSDGVKIITVEKVWKYSTQKGQGGISEKDSGKLKRYVDYIFQNPRDFGLPKDLLKSSAVKIFSGHSRGAAACLPSWVWNVDQRFGSSGLKNAHLVCLDPVSGQTGNGYWMGKNWTTPALYSGFRLMR
ncbi:MAG: hypothetical protein AAGF23_15890 [Acidobacteriota bacterium]